MMDNKTYWVMDGRANYSIDNAMVLVCCPGLDDAYDCWKEFGADTCIVDPDTQEVVDSLMWRESQDANDKEED
jgi:hypothetical protein